MSLCAQSQPHGRHIDRRRNLLKRLLLKKHFTHTTIMDIGDPELFHECGRRHSATAGQPHSHRKGGGCNPLKEKGTKTEKKVDAKGIELQAPPIPTHPN